MSAGLGAGPATRENLYKHLRLALSALDDESAQDLLREVAWACAAKALEFLDDERSMTDVLAVAQRAAGRGDGDWACRILSAVASRLPEYVVVRLGNQGCATGLLRMVDVALQELRRRDLPAPAGWTQALLDDPGHDWSVEAAGRACKSSTAEVGPVAEASPSRTPKGEEILTRILIDPDAYDLLREFLQPDHLESAGHRLILRACDALRSEGRPVDIVQVARWLRDHDLLDEVGGLAFVMQLLDDAAHRGESSEEVLLTGLLNRERDSAFPIKADLHDTFDRIAKANARGARITGTPTGFDRYDRITSGLHDGELTIVAARPGMGKTSLVLNMAANVASPQELVSAHDTNERWMDPGCGVVVFSLEMPREQIVHRMLCSEARVELAKVRTGMLTKSDWEKLTQAAGRLAGLPIWVKAEPCLGYDAIRNTSARLKAEFETFAVTGERMRRIGLIVIDGWHRVRGRRTRRRLRDIARELMVPIIATIEAPPDTGEQGARRLGPFDLDLSEDDADNVCLLHRESYYGRDAESEVAEVVIGWQANGPPDTVRLRWDSRCLHFDDLRGGESHASSR